MAQRVSAVLRFTISQHSDLGNFLCPARWVVCLNICELQRGCIRVGGDGVSGFSTLNFGKDRKTMDNLDRVMISV